MKALVFGSVNIDHVYQLPHPLRPGETLSSTAYRRTAGGKGLNQAIALARAGQQVSFAGGVGQDGLFLRDALAQEGVDTACLRVTQEPTGHAIIHVDDQGGNAIVLYGGANQMVDQALITAALDTLRPGDLVLLQHEINLVEEIIGEAHARGLTVALNPSPSVPEMASWPLEKVDWLLLNEVEGEDLTGCADPEEAINVLLARYPACQVVLTLGDKGAVYGHGDIRLRQAAMPVKAVDTTAAGDTFTGYFLQAVLSGRGIQEALKRAACAAAMAVERPGASASIPTHNEVEARLGEM